MGGKYPKLVSIHADHPDLGHPDLLIGANAGRSLAIETDCWPPNAKKNGRQASATNRHAKARAASPANLADHQRMAGEELLLLLSCAGVPLNADYVIGGYYRAAAASSTISATKSPSGFGPRSPRPCARTATIPSFASRLPTTAMYGIFHTSASRIR